MPWAEFEEKEYEDACLVELGRGGRVYGAGPVLERLLGYDAAADPGHVHPIWALLAVPRPRGLRLLPALWAPGTEPPLARLPRAVVSLLVQYKPSTCTARGPPNGGSGERLTSELREVPASILSCAVSSEISATKRSSGMPLQRFGGAASSKQQSFETRCWRDPGL
jgi:hypothetical protein